ncbi:Hypothetical predicted protein [Mytilus galloprovincialis]|uniref:Uncharacterized protein n=1 Tax=Mytilus galloprovincialis TaxID=29158 RepID=A0A8B6ER74_MYTGA|nr:Hypothetical predicted protein [Mytilus galloprovincialis]
MPKDTKKTVAAIPNTGKKEPFLKAGRKQKDALYQKKRIQKTTQIDRDGNGSLPHSKTHQEDSPKLPLTSTLEEYKVSKIRLVMTLRDSKDSKISKAGIQTRTGRKWSARTAVDQAESILHHKDIVSNTCTGRQGLGMTHFQQWSKATQKEKSSMVQSKIRTVEEEQRRAKAVELSRQGAWMKWWNLPERKITWEELWRMEPFRISFMLSYCSSNGYSITMGRVVTIPLEVRTFAARISLSPPLRTSSIVPNLRKSHGDSSEREIRDMQQSHNSTSSWTRAVNGTRELTLERSSYFQNAYRQPSAQTL